MRTGYLVVTANSTYFYMRNLYKIQNKLYITVDHFFDMNDGIMDIGISREIIIIQEFNGGVRFGIN